VVSRDQKTCHLVPTWQDIDVLQSVHSAIKNLADFTDMLSGEDRVTLSSLRAVLHILKNQVLVESSVDTTLTKDIKRRILTYLDGKYTDIETSKLMDLSSFLDARFITDYIGNSDLAIVKDRLIREGSEILTKPQQRAVRVQSLYRIMKVRMMMLGFSLSEGSCQVD